MGVRCVFSSTRARMKFLPADGHTGGGGGGGHGGLVAQVPLIQGRGRIANTFLRRKIIIVLILVLCCSSQYLTHLF